MNTKEIGARLHERPKLDPQIQSKDFWGDPTLAGPPEQEARLDEYRLMYIRDLLGPIATERDAECVLAWAKHLTGFRRITLGWEEPNDLALVGMTDEPPPHSIFSTREDLVRAAQKANINLSIWIHQNRDLLIAQRWRVCAGDYWPCPPNTAVFKWERLPEE